MLCRLLLAFIAERYLSRKDLLDSLANTVLLCCGARLETPTYLPSVPTSFCVCVCVFPPISASKCWEFTLNY